MNLEETDEDLISQNFLSRREITFENDADPPVQSKYPDIGWSVENHTIMLNECRYSHPQILYPNKKEFRGRLKAGSGHFPNEFNNKMTQYATASTEFLASGISYEKLVDNSEVVFRHRAARSLISIFHLILLDEEPEDK